MIFCSNKAQQGRDIYSNYKNWFHGHCSIYNYVNSILLRHNMEWAGMSTEYNL
jgi:hypothetical protein